MKTKLIIVLTLLIVFVGSIYALSTIYPYYTKRIKYKVYSFIRHKNTNISNVGYKRSIRIDSYNKHRRFAKKQGIPLLKNTKYIDKYAKNGRLVKVKNAKGYAVAKLNYSKALLGKNAYSALKELGVEFQKLAGKNNYFVVTSLTRSNDSQKRLTMHNSNATHGISTHSYGASFDISFSRFNGRRGHNIRLQNKLEEALSNLQKKKKILVLIEKKNYCYHITVR